MNGIGANPNNGLVLSPQYIIKTPGAATISPNQYIVQTKHLWQPFGSVPLSQQQMAATTPATAAQLIRQQYQAQTQAAAAMAGGITSSNPTAAPGNYCGPRMFFNAGVMPSAAAKQTWLPTIPKLGKKNTPENRPNSFAQQQQQQRQNSRFNDSFDNLRARHTNNNSPPRDRHEGGRSSRNSPPRHRHGNKYSDPRVPTHKDRDYPRGRSRRDYKLSPVRTHYPPYSRVRDQYREERDYEKSSPTPPPANRFNVQQQQTLHYHSDSNPRPVEPARRRYSPARRLQDSRYQDQNSRWRGYDSDRGRSRRYSDYYYSRSSRNSRRDTSSSSSSDYNYRGDRSPPPRSPSSRYSGYSSRASGRAYSVAPTQSILRKGGDGETDRRRRAFSIANFRRSRSPEKKRVRWNPDLENLENTRPATGKTSPASPPLAEPTTKPFFTPISGAPDVSASGPSVLLANFNHDLMQKTQLSGTITAAPSNGEEMESRREDISDEGATSEEDAGTPPNQALPFNPLEMVDSEGETLPSKPVNWRVAYYFSGRVDSKLLHNSISFAGARPQSAAGRTFPLPFQHPTPQQLNDPNFHVPGAISSEEEEEDEMSEMEVEQEESQKLKPEAPEVAKGQKNEPKKTTEDGYPVHFLLRNNKLSV